MENPFRNCPSKPRLVVGGGGGVAAGHVAALVRHLLAQRRLPQHFAVAPVQGHDLEALAAREMVRRSAPDDAPGRARRILAAYVRLTTAPNSPGFTVSLLEDLIALTFAGSLGDGEKHMA